MGKNITLVGGNGDGQTCKVANQIIVALNIEAVGEALLFASKAGADPAKVRQALMGGFAASRILEVHGERMIKRTFDPGFRIELHQKDLNLALSGARALGVVAAEHRDRAGALQRLRGARRREVGPLRDGARAGEARQPRDHQAVLTTTRGPEGPHHDSRRADLLGPPTSADAGNEDPARGDRSAPGDTRLSGAEHTPAGKPPNT